MSKHGLTRNLVVIAAVLTVTFIITLVDNSVSAGNILSRYQTEIVNKNSNQSENVLSAIDKYQENYFTIIKRNNVLLNFENSSELVQDRKELKKLFANVKKKISNKKYLKEYKEIEKRYSKFNGETTTEMNEFAQNNYIEIDALLNKVYKDIELKISPKDFQNLVLSEKKWLQEVENYKKVYDSFEYGTIGISTLYDYETNMKEFRTLLLMMYL